MGHAKAARFDCAPSRKPECPTQSLMIWQPTVDEIAASEPMRRNRRECDAGSYVVLELALEWVSLAL